MTRFRTPLISLVVLLQSLLQIGSIAHAAMPLSMSRMTDCSQMHESQPAGASAQHQAAAHDHSASNVAACCAHGHCDCGTTSASALPLALPAAINRRTLVPDIAIAMLSTPTSRSTLLLRPPIVLLS